jgi:CBS-domain-containing membrane protein
MKDLSKLHVRDVMHTDVATTSRNDMADQADRMMQDGAIRHLPVLDDDGLLAGVLTRSDLFRGALASALGYGEHAQTRTLAMLRVKEVMTTDPHTVAPDASLAEAAAVMVEHKIGCLPVLDGEKLAGILTLSRLAELIAEGAP